MNNQKPNLLMSTVPYPEEIWLQCFQLGVWSCFLNTSKILLVYNVFYTFYNFLKTV